MVMAAFAHDLNLRPNVQKCRSLIKFRENQSHLRRLNSAFYECNSEQLRNRRSFLVWSKMGIPKRHCHTAVAQQLTNCIERHACLGESRCEMMSQIVPAKADGDFCSV